MRIVMQPVPRHVCPAAAVAACQRFLRRSGCRRGHLVSSLTHAWNIYRGVEVAFRRCRFCWHYTACLIRKKWWNWHWKSSVLWFLVVIGCSYSPVTRVSFQIMRIWENGNAVSENVVLCYFGQSNTNTDIQALVNWSDDSINLCFTWLFCYLNQLRWTPN